jgi:hypothetical protein
MKFRTLRFAVIGAAAVSVGGEGSDTDSVLGGGAR